MKNGATEPADIVRWERGRHQPEREGVSGQLIVNGFLDRFGSCLHLRLLSHLSLRFS